MAILNYIAGIIVFYMAFQYAFSKRMVLKYPVLRKGELMYVSQNMSFMLFSIATSMIFLGPLSLVKYFVWILILAILYLGRYKKKSSIIMSTYWIFLIWCMYALTYSQDMSQGINMLIKYFLPVLYFLLGYNAVETKDDIIVFMKYTTIVGVVYATLIGGVTWRIATPIYNFLQFSGLIITYASLADFFSCIICAPIVLYILTKDKKYLYAAGWMMLSTIAHAVRTGLGASVMAVSLFTIIVYKAKAIPYVALVGILAICAVQFIPSLNDKMFGKEVNTTDISMSFGGKSIAMSGRNYTWNWSLKKYHDGHELVGSGLGTALSGLKAKRDGALMHSDYVQMRCEIGDFGLALFVLFGVVAILKTLLVTLRYSNNFMLTVVGAMALGSLAGMLFCMLFDNVVTYSQQAFVIPFIFLGIFEKCIDIKVS